jgi:HAD superfamily hydrolase (TIGR01509 family)
MNLQAIIFDMDGVLADSEPMWDQIDATMLRHYGVDYNGEFKQDILGRSFPLALKYYSEKFGLRTDIEEMALRRRTIAADFYAKHIPLFEVTHSVLAEVSAQLPIGLATSSIVELVDPFLERHDIRKYFTAVTTGDEVQNGKPHPDIYLRAAEKLKIAPEKCLVVEDALAGIEAGKSAGMTVAAIPDPRYVDVSLYPDRADFVMSKLDELPALVARLRSS